MSQAFYYDEETQQWKPIMSTMDLGELTEHAEDKTIHVTPEDKLNWNSKANHSHSHEINQINGLEQSLREKSQVGHSHQIESINNLKTELDGKAPFSHYHDIYEINNLETRLSDKAESSHTHSIEEINNLQSSLNSKAALSHNHGVGDITGLQLELNKKANTTHRHNKNEIDGLVELENSINQKAAISHNHNLEDIINNEILAKKEDLDKIEVGGENLLNHTADFFDTGYLVNVGPTNSLSVNNIEKYNNYNSLTVNVTSGANGFRWKPLELELNQEYTLSAMIKSSSVIDPNSENTLSPLGFHVGGLHPTAENTKVIKQVNSYNEDDKNKWKRLYVTFKLIGTNKMITPYIYVNYVSPLQLFVTCVKLEKGNKPTDYSPSYHDLTEKLLSHTVSNLYAGRNIIASQDIYDVSNAVFDKNAYATEGKVRIETSANAVTGIKINVGNKLKPSTRYSLSYYYQKTSGRLVSFGGHTDAAYSLNLAFLNGENRYTQYNNLNSVFKADDTNKRRVQIIFNTPETINPSDSVYIQPNRTKTDIVGVEITELTLTEGIIPVAWSPALDEVSTSNTGVVYSSAEPSNRNVLWVKT